MKPQVTVSLKPYLQDFLYHEFGADPKECTDGLMVSGMTEVGKYISSLVTVSTHRPRSEGKAADRLTLLLPVLEWNHYILNEHWVCIPTWKQHQLQDYLEQMFRIRLREYFLVGYEKGFRQEQITQAFLMAYNIKNRALSYDMVKKYDYRNRKRTTQEVNRVIQESLWLPH
jgi:hypothetical protein